MVKFEDGVDSHRYVTPALVREIKSGGPAGAWIVFAQGDGFFVSMSPDEVHAKLFPEAPEHALEVAAKRDAATQRERHEATQRVLTWVADKWPSDWQELVASMKADALKALGREG